MISRVEAEGLVEDGADVVALDGEVLGSLVRVFLDEYTGWPSFMTVELNPSNAHETFVALHQAHVKDGKVYVPYDRQRVHNAPLVPTGQDLSTREEDELFDYYGVPIEGVEPSVAHLGATLTVTEDGVDEEPANRPTSQADQGRGPE